ncbi:MAG: YciI family protein [bacterium]
MRYMLLIYTNEATDAKAGTPEADARMAGYMAFGEEAGAAGVILAGDRLEPVSAARTVRIRDGKTVSADGPFAETKEQLGGYYIIESKSVEEAAAWGAKLPGAKDGSIEVRPIWEM